MKKLFFLILSVIFLIAPLGVLAEDQQIICPQPYGGGVVCGVHTVVNTGIADNIGLVGIGLILASGAFFLISRKMKQKQI